MKITATCATCRTLGWPARMSLYGSTPISGEHHARAAWAKATRIAMEHAATTGHDTDATHGSKRVTFRCRCEKCDAPTPGSATGLCEKCLFNQIGTGV